MAYIKKSLKFSILPLLLCLLWACSNDETTNEADEKIAKISVKVSIQRLEPALFSCKSSDDILSFLHKNSGIASQYFQTPPEGFKTLAQKLFTFTNAPSLQEFYRSSQDAAFFGNLQNMEADFREAFQHLKYYYPQFKEPKIYTIFTGFAAKDLSVSDSVIVIGLDYYMGSRAKYHPDLYTYQLRTYQKEYIVPKIITLLSANYIATDMQDKTLLAEMLFYGKGYEFAQTMLPSKDDSLFIGYTGVQLEGTEDAQDLVWAHFVDEKLFFQTSDFVKKKYTEERPGTPEIGPKCPGSIGRWVGWKKQFFIYKMSPN